MRDSATIGAPLRGLLPCMPCNTCHHDNVEHTVRLVLFFFHIEAIGIFEANNKSELIEMANDLCLLNPSIRDPGTVICHR